MSTSTIEVPVLSSQTIADPHDPRVIPSNKLTTRLLSEGYEFTQFRTRSRDAAKDEAARIRKDPTQLAVLLTLMGGWYGVVVKEADARTPRTDKPTRPAVPVQFENLSFASAREARAFATRLIEAAKQAEFDYDVAQAAAKKSEVEASE